jgi:hypothetical protein
MVPASVTLLDTFPQAANGKLDRKALLTPDKFVIVIEDTNPNQDPSQSIALAEFIAGLIQQLKGFAPSVDEPLAILGMVRRFVASILSKS